MNLCNSPPLSSAEVPAADDIQGVLGARAVKKNSTIAQLHGTMTLKAHGSHMQQLYGWAQSLKAPLQAVNLQYAQHNVEDEHQIVITIS